MSDLAQKRCAAVIKMLVEICPQLKPLMLSELQTELQRWGAPTALFVVLYNAFPSSAVSLSCKGQVDLRWAT